MSPDMIRNCCGGLFYGKSVAEVKKETLMIKGATDDFLNSVYYVKKSVKRCQKCKNSHVQKKPFALNCFKIGFIKRIRFS